MSPGSPLVTSGGTGARAPGTARGTGRGPPRSARRPAPARRRRGTHHRIRRRLDGREPAGAHRGQQPRPRTPRPRSCSTSRSRHPSTSARIWRHSGLAVPPPDARICAGAGIPASTIRSSPSRSPKATPSRTARVRWRRSWARVSPTNAPRASGSGCGLRSPDRYGRNSSPSLPAGTPAAAPTRSSNALARRDRVPEPAQAARRREHHRHHVPPARDRVAEGVDAALRLEERAVGGREHHAGRPQRQRHPPRHDRPDPDRVRRLVAATGHHRACPARSPVASAAAAVTTPVTSGPSNVAGSQARVDPQRLEHDLGDQSRAARSNSSVPAPSALSRACSPVSRSRT